MPVLMGIDIETYSSAPLPKCGVYRYCDAPDFEILLFSYAFDDEPVQTIDLASGETLPLEVISALEDILSGRYTPTEQDDRYTFIGGSTTGGLVVYDDKYAFFHHATDPAGGKLCNAFDLVRWHLFTPGGTAPDGSSVGNEASSMSAMRAYAAADESVT